MQISRKAKLIGLAAAALLVVVALVLTLVLWPAGQPAKLTDPNQFEAESGIYITANSAYDGKGAVTLKAMQDGGDGWKQFYFEVKTDDALSELYILPLKSGILIDEVVLSDGTINATLQSQFSKIMLKADFNSLESLDGAYGFAPCGEGLSQNGKCLKADDLASRLLYLMQNGKAAEGVGISESGDPTGGIYGFSFWIKYDWSGTDYDNLFYAGFNTAKKETTAE